MMTNYILTANKLKCRRLARTPSWASVVSPAGSRIGDCLISLAITRSPTDGMKSLVN